MKIEESIKHCPIQDTNNDFCCTKALHDQYDKDCIECLEQTKKEIKIFIKYLRAND